ncbi:GNAT family N-acetyltransferase [Paenibacillus sp. DMB20]|uniref:GNAT family N-acetyltransferase n=1 Tax=Paenibacillus sp. DMB20 TaxID=1642570 RepID=UPI000A8E21A7
MPANKASLRSGLGYVMGSLAYFVLKKEFNAPLPYFDETGYIECVATLEKARGQGVSTALMRHVMHQLHFHHYVLEVVDTNEIAYRLYKKLGFEEFERKQAKPSPKRGFNERIYMQWNKPDVPL